MWGEGGRFYWGRKGGGGGGRVAGIIVVFAWISSQEKQLQPFVDLYGSIGWNSLVCHADFLNLYFPDKATSLAYAVLNELLKEVKIRPLPIVFATFSGGAKGCMYKVLQMIDGNREAQINLDEYQLVRACFCGHVYDSSPVDFTSELAAQFALHPTVGIHPQPPRIISWFARAIASGLDALFLNRFEAQRAEYWQTLYSSANMGPFLILCSDDDDIAPCLSICNFAYHLQDLGADVKVVKWNSSPHLGHYQHYPINYKAAVTELLEKAALLYTQRAQPFYGERTSRGSGCNEISRSVYNLRKAALNSNESLRRVAISPSDHFFLPSSVEYHDNKGVSSIQDEQKERLVNLQEPPGINAHSVLGKMLFDVCVPKNVEDWDIKMVGSVSRPSFSFSRRRSPFNPMKCIRRSRL